MKIHPNSVASALFLSFTAASLFAADVRMNHIGFHTNGSKKAVILNGTAEPIVVKNAQGVAVDTAQVGATSLWSPSGENAAVADFSDVKAPGTYALYQGSTKIGRDFSVAASPWDTVLKASLKFYYYQRASSALSSTDVGTYSRSAGHPDNSVSLSFVGGGSAISSPKGWYDAGDYGKYIVNAGITTSTLMLLYEHFQAYFDALKWNSPESNNGKSDLLDEIKWNLDWMLTMQTTDGGVYSKLTTEVFSGDVMPSADNATRYVFMKTTAATYDFAAVMAHASRIFANYDASFAANCLVAAEKAYSWGKANPAVYYSQPATVNTGEYGDHNVKDEQLWAASQLYLSKKTASYLTDVNSLLGQVSASTPSWAGVGTLGYLTMALYPNEFGASALQAKDSVMRVANSLRNTAENSSYGVPMISSDFVWGSNAVVANQGLVLLHGFYLTEDVRYLNAARGAMDYLLGRNPLDRTYLSGFGMNSPKKPHHRPSQADGISAPVPGMLAGGPHNGGQDVGSETWQCQEYRVIGKPALSFTDNACSYATNEVAINWNAPFAYLSGSLDALYNGQPFMGKVLSIPSAIGIKRMARSFSQSNAKVLWTKEGLRVQVQNGDGNQKQLYRLDGQRD